MRIKLLLESIFSPIAFINYVKKSLCGNPRNPFEGTPGKYNAITDVDGVEAGLQL